MCGPVSSWGSQRSSFGDLARLCPRLYTLVLPGSSGHNTASYHLPPAQGQPSPPLGHDLVVMRRCPQLLQLTSSQALPLGMGAVQCQAQTESNGLLCELCYCMQTPLVGASWPSHLLDGSQRPGGMPLSPGSCHLSGYWFCVGRRWKELRSLLESSQR